MQPNPTARRSIGELEADGLFAGGVGGLVLLVVQMMLAGLTGRSLLLPLRYASSVVLGDTALGAPTGFVAVVGLLVHASASMLFGFLFSLVASEERRRTRRSPAMQAWFGALAGLLIWLVDIQLVARFYYPWIYAAGPVVQLIVHVVAFGIPMGLAYAWLRPRPSSKR